MRSSLLNTLAVLAGLASANIAGASDGTYFQQSVHYTIHAKLDTDAHMLTGTETIRYQNNSPDTLTEFYLHLYPNAYRSQDSALLRDYGQAYNVILVGLPEAYRGYLDIMDVTVDGAPVNPEIDDTIARLALPSPLAPGASMEITLRFEEKIRRHIGRAGYRGKHYDLAQWYPKVVVYDENGFHPDKFRRGEFYGEFGEFEVFIELPEDYVVAATGTLREGDPGWTLNPADPPEKSAGEKSADNKKGSGDEEARLKTVHFSARDVHDFAWCADPTFVVQDTTVAGIDIRSFYRRENVAWKDSTLAHAVRAMNWLTEKVGPYPYPQVSVVDALLPGGMEYPMLVMDGRASEGLVVHEIGHIYFYGILGNNEREAAWLDEGFTTFQTGWYEIEHYGDHGITLDWNWYQRSTPQMTVLERARQQVFWLQRAKYHERVATRSDEFVNDYYTHVYRKAALMLHALRYVLGEATFDSVLKEYYDRWKLKHVNEERFIQVCEEVSGMDLDIFFEQWLHTRKICDYRLVQARTKASPGGDSYVTNVRIERLGEMIMPLEIHFTFADGSVEKSRIDGKLRTIEQSFNFPERPKRVAINPNNEICDINLSDNFIPRRRSFQFDWPNNDYSPESAYQIRYRPGVWYNDIDGLKAGLHLSGNYANWTNKVRLGVYYGAKSDRLDFSTSYAKPVRLLRKNGRLSLSGYKMEGRQDFTFDLQVFRRPTLMRPPTHRFRFGINYHELTNARFVKNPETYQENPEFAPYFSYGVDPQLDVGEINFDLSLRLGRDWFGTDYKYSKWMANTTFHTRSEAYDFFPVDVRMRLFLGLAGGSVPLQQKFYLAGGGPLAEEKIFFMRSPGAIWEELHYHEPGHGNLRGYQAGGFGVNRLLAMNFEIARNVPLLGSKPMDRLARVRAHAFLDIGRSFDKKNPIGGSSRVQDLVDGGILDETLVDAGVGFLLRRPLPFYDLTVRFDIPFYVNHPEINGEKDETKYRYLFSLVSTF